MNTLKVAIVGAGIIGCSWAMVWARRGHSVAIYDADAATRARALDTLAAFAEDLDRVGMTVPADSLAHVRIATTLADAVVQADYVQESVPEKLDLKRALFAELDTLAQPGAILASSTSALGMSRFTAELSGRGRCVLRSD